MQLDLLSAARELEKPRKAVRNVSRANIYKLKDSGQLSARTTMVLNGLAHRYYVLQEWATPAELTRWLFQHGKIPRESTNIVAPRISDLVNGAWTKQKDGSRVKVGGGVCELLPKRMCSVTNSQAHPIRIREAGSVLDQHGYGGQ